MFKLSIRKTICLISLAALTVLVSGCAVYEKEEYYESGQLKSKEYTKAWSVRAK